MLSVPIQNTILQSVVMIEVIMLSVIILDVILNIFMLSHYAYCYLLFHNIHCLQGIYAECHYTEFHHCECNFRYSQMSL